MHPGEPAEETFGDLNTCIKSMIPGTGMVLPPWMMSRGKVFAMNGKTILRVAFLALIVLPALAMVPDFVRYMKIRSM
jgi:hypothetical protein